MKNDLQPSIIRGMEHMMNNFDNDREGLPWFDIRLRHNEPGYLEHFPCFDGAHVPGRCLDGLLYAESITGKPVPDAVIQIYRKFLFQSFQGEDRLNGYMHPESKVRSIVFHNFREGLLALNALVRWRNDQEAKRIADRMLEAVNRMTNPDGSWNESTLTELRKGIMLEYSDVPTGTSGRFVGALLKYYRTTGSGLAMELARKFADYALRECFHPDGSFAEKAGNHVHSITSTISSLADYYDLVNDKSGLDRVKLIYDRGMSPYRSSFGWVKELIGPEHMGGEVNSTGDLVQTALILGKCGYRGYYADAEKMIRGHLLPSQVWDETCIDPHWLVQLDNTAEDRYKHIALRLRGGFGFPTPEDRAPLHYENDYVRITTLDITGGSIQALCEAWNEAITKEPYGWKIHLLFDRHVGPIRWARFPDLSDRYTLHGETQEPIWIRIPSNVRKNGISVRREGKSLPVTYIDDYLIIEPDGASVLKAEITLPCESFAGSETLCGKQYLVSWRGEQVVSINPSGSVSPMYLP